MAQKSGTLAPRIGTLRLAHLVDGDSGQLQPHESYDGERYVAADLSGDALAGISFSECEFLDLSAHETDFRSASFSDTRFERLNAPIFSAPRSSFREVVVEGSRVGSAEFYEANWASVHFVNCKLGFVNLRGAELQDVLFTNCVIDELDLGGSRASRVSFVASQVNSLDLSRATLKSVDLRGLEMRQLTNLEGLRGATVSDAQITELAPLFAAHFGIVVEG